MEKWREDEAKEKLEGAKNPSTRAEWRRLAGTGMVSAIGEYTPVEFISLIDYIEQLEKELNDALSGKWVGL